MNRPLKNLSLKQAGPFVQLKPSLVSGTKVFSKSRCMLRIKMKFRCFPRLYAALEKYARIFFVFLYAFIYCMVKEIETYKALKTYKKSMQG